MTDEQKTRLKAKFDAEMNADGEIVFVPGMGWIYEIPLGPPQECVLGKKETFDD